MRFRIRRVSIAVALLLGLATAAPAADVDSLIRKGDQALAAGRLADAEAYYRKGLSKSPMHPLLHLDLGIVLGKQGRHQEALRELRLSESLVPGWDVSYWLTDTLLALGRWSECQATARRLVEMRPQSLEALDRLGMCAERAGDHVVATDALNRAVAIEDLVDRQRWLAWARYGTGDYPGANAAARRGVGMGDTPDVEARVAEANRADLEHVLGLSELALGNLEEARRWLGDNPAIGVRVETLPDGLRVTQVFRSMPADRAGVLPGDLITACNGVAIGKDRPDLADLLRVQPAGAAVTLSVRRGGEPLELVAPLSLAAPAPTTGQPARAGDLSGDRASAGRGLEVYAVAVEPRAVPLGSGFRVVVEMTTRTGSDAVTVPVRLTLAILQDGKELTRTDWEEDVLAGGRRRLVKEVPRAAGAPGRYTVAVRAESPVGSGEASAEFEIVP